MNNFSEKVGFIWSVADLLRGDYKQSDYGKVILPLTVLRRLDCVLEKTKARVLARATTLPDKADEAMRELLLCQAAGFSFYNTSRFVFQATDEVPKDASYVSLFADPGHLAANLNNYLNGFSAGAREVFLDKFKLGEQIDRLDESNLLYLVLAKFLDIDLHPDVVDNHEMGYVFEELIRRFSEQSNETAGEHFTPREVIRLMVNLLFNEDGEALTKKGVIRTLYDPACGTGGMLSVAENYLLELNPSATLKVYGQELNPESYGICKSDMLIKGEDASNVKFGNSFSQDGLPDGRFDYFLSNPPFGVEWKKVERAVRDEHEKLGMSGRFGAGLPRISDGSLLFLQHMLSKFKKDGQGSRLAIVFNGSPLFTGGAGSGESEIRRWVIENDWLEGIVALPEQLFYNTGIATYVWVVTNRKSPERRGKVQLVNAVSFFVKMRKSLGNKRNEIGDGTNGKPDQIGQISRLYGEFKPGPFCRVFDNDDFGYWRVTVERPLRLNFAAAPERVARVKDIDKQPGLREALNGLAGDGVVKDREKFTGRLKAALRSGGVVLSPAAVKSVIAALGERDETAEVCRDGKGQPEPDPELRDYENVPLKEDIQAYFDRKVKPHVPDAWIDESKTKKGYEIPLTRHFYEYTTLRPLEEIEAEIMSLEGEIQRMLKRTMS
jgi:type I restriction enzyme M protein